MQSTDSHDGQIPGAAPPSFVSASPDSSPHTSKSGFFIPGDIVGGSYEILDSLGRGAMGMVYKVKHVSMPAQYALKVLITDKLTDIAVIRFQNEAQAIAKLNHPNIIAIYNFGLHDGRLPFYVMDLLYGDNLLDKLEVYGPMPVQLALPTFIEVATGLSYAHRKGILHRDVKPANFVILDAPDVRGAHVKVVDFGIVKFAEEIKADVQKLTALGDVCGSPSYMSPEQSSGGKIDSRSDIYSLGCSLFQALTGKLPFFGRSATETMLMHHEIVVPTLTSKGDGRSFSEDLELLVAKMLAKEPMNRYQTMESVAQDLRNVMEGKPLGTPQIAPATSGTGAANNSDSLFAPRQAAHRSATVTSGNVNVSQLTQSIGAVQISDTERANAEVANVERAAISRTTPQRTATQRTSSYNNDQSVTGDEKLNNEPVADTNKLKRIALCVLLVSLVSTIVFCGWQVLQPAKQSAKSGQAPAGESTKVDPANAKTADKTGLNLLDLESPPNFEETGPVDLTKARYFSKIVSENGKEFVEFDFPKPTKGEGLAFIGPSVSDCHRAEGKVRFAKGATLYLAPTPGTLRVPLFFEKFRPGEIAGIVLLPMNASDELFEASVRVPGISQLIMNNCPQLTNKIVPSLGKLNLTVFSVVGLRIGSVQLARAHFWQNLQALSLSHCNDLTPILQRLSGSKNLAALDVSENQLSANDYQLIAKLPNLAFLNLERDRLTTEELRALSRLPHLNSIVAAYTRMRGESMVEELRHFNVLKNLIILKGSMKIKDLHRLQQERPDLRVRELSADQIDQTRNMFKAHW